MVLSIGLAIERPRNDPGGGRGGQTRPEDNSSRRINATVVLRHIDPVCSGSSVLLDRVAARVRFISPRLGQSDEDPRPARRKEFNPHHRFLLSLSRDPREMKERRSNVLSKLLSRRLRTRDRVNGEGFFPSLPRAACDR